MITMINIASLNKKTDVGKLVVYSSGGTRETGKITSWNEKYIFVSFPNSDGKFSDTACSCVPEHLAWLSGDLGVKARCGKFAKLRHQ